jgi:hypothetical protein
MEPRHVQLLKKLQHVQYATSIAEEKKGGGSSSMAEGRKKADGASLAAVWRRRE